MSRAMSQSPGASAEAIRHHYDLGNDFYALWLDPGMFYSCALWRDGAEDEDLATAQLRKVDWHLDHAAAAGASRLLDVGCGWGSLLARATGAYRVKHAVGLTLSQAQAEWIEGRRLPNVDVRVESWADHVAEVPYDAIVSIGAFEHFARLDQSPADKVEGYRRFFQCCHDALQATGRLSLQTITYGTADRKDFSPFFASEIFPQSDLPHLTDIAEAVRDTFEIVELRNDRQHYARTLRLWLANLRAHKGTATELVGSESVARYERYLGMMIVAFHTGTMNLCRIAMRPIAGRSR